MVDYVITFAAGTATGILLERFVFAKMKENRIQNRTNALQACFGEPMIATRFTFEEVKQWIYARKDRLVNGTKAAVVEVNENTMKSLGKDLDTKGVENYIVLVIMTADRQIADSLLIKYEKLDQELENALARGNGVLVVQE